MGGTTRNVGEWIEMGPHLLVSLQEVKGDLITGDMSAIASKDGELGFKRMKPSIPEILFLRQARSAIASH